MIADGNRLVQVLEPKAVLRDGLQVVIVGRRAKGQDQEIIGQWAGGGNQLPPRQIDAGDLGHAELQVLLVPQDGAHGIGDLARRQAGGGDLVQEGLKQVIIAPIHQHHLDARSAQSLRGSQPAKAGPHDCHDGRGFRHSESPRETGLGAAPPA